MKYLFTFLIACVVSAVILAISPLALIYFIFKLFAPTKKEDLKVLKKGKQMTRQQFLMSDLTLFNN